MMEFLKEIMFFYRAHKYIINAQPHGLVLIQHLIQAPQKVQQDYLHQLHGGYIVVKHSLFLIGQ